MSILDNKTKERLRIIAEFYLEKGRMPTFSEIGELIGVKSKNAVFKFVAKAKKLGYIAQDEKGKLIPVTLKRIVKLLGTVEAGFPSPAEEELLDTISLDNFLIKNPSATYMLKVSGDSMSDAGILPGDLVLVDRSLQPKNGDIVIAQVDGEWTMKYLIKEGKDCILMPANKKYKPIKPEKELLVAGVVVAVIRKYR